MKRFKKTYAKIGTLLRLALDICKGISEVSKCASEVNECKSGVNDVRTIFVSKRRIRGEIPT